MKAGTEEYKQYLRDYYQKHKEDILQKKRASYDGRKDRRDKKIIIPRDKVQTEYNIVQFTELSTEKTIRLLEQIINRERLLTI